MKDNFLSNVVSIFQALTGSLQPEQNAEFHIPYSLFGALVSVVAFPYCV
jgi:hypothetical protein